MFSFHFRLDIFSIWLIQAVVVRVTDICLFFGKRRLIIGAMNVDFPPFKNGEHNSESASTINWGLTPFNEIKNTQPCYPFEIQIPAVGGAFIDAAPNLTSFVERAAAS